jgi:hypothetical protein
MAKLLSNFDVQVLNNNVDIEGQKLQVFNFVRKDKKKIQRKEMIQICDEMKKSFQKKHKDGLIEISIKYPQRWYSGDCSRLFESLNVFNMNDYEEFDKDPEEYLEFRLYFVPIVFKPEGGKDKHNDCLITCIKKIIQSHKDDIDAEELKKILGIKRDDKIKINHLPKVEQYIKQQTDMDYAIFVSGDYQYTSKSKSLKQIHLILSNEHYTLDKLKYYKRKHTATEEKKILMHELIDGEYKCFDGENQYFISKEDYNHLYSNPLSSEYILVEKNFIFDVKKRQLDIEDSFHEYLEMADKIKEQSNGYINFYKCGSVKHMALNLFFDKVKSVFPDEISNIEAEYIHDASYSALTYWERYSGTVHCYDKNSQYPFLMSRNYNKFPIKEGEFRFIKSIDDKPLYGIYRCIITKPEDKPYKFFKFNQRNHYTHLDIEVARKYGLNIELIIDDKANFLYYSDDKLMNGAFLFKHYMNDLYELKLQKVKGAKDIMNILWGALCESNIYKRNINFNEEVSIKDFKVLSFNGDEDRLNLKLLPKKTKQFKLNWARMKPFLLAYGRSFLYHAYQKYEDITIRINTDGIYFSEMPKELHEQATDLKVNWKLGYLKYEGSKEINLTGLNKGLHKK